MDALAVETMLGSFAIGSLFSLEIMGDATSRRFLLRGTPDALAHICRQIQATYDQVSFRTLSPEEDPARPSRLPSSTAQLTLLRPAYLPLRTYEDGAFEEADPVRGLLAAFDGLEGEERALAQILLSPAPPRWSVRFEGSARQVEKTFSGETVTFSTALRQFLSLVAVMSAIAFGLWALFSFVQQNWLAFIVASLLVSAAFAAILYLYGHLQELTNIDPELVRKKISTPAFDVALRLLVVGKTQARTEGKLRELAAAYRRANLQSGNSLVCHRSQFDPQVLSLDRPSWWREFTGHVMRLNVSELASLWHLPVGRGTPLVERNLTRRILPLPNQVGEGVLVGHAVHQGRTIPVHLPTDALRHHTFMVAKTQKGKSTLMAHLAAAAMEMETALVVIDPHGDLARSVLRLVPRERVGDVLYVDFSDTQQFVGLNVLDMSQGRNADAIVSNIVHVGELIWSDYWGPRMEDALRMGLRTLLMINEKLVQDGKPQFTLIDIPTLFEVHPLRKKLLDDYVTDGEIKQWWTGYFDKLYASLRMDVVNPVLTKIHRFSTHSVVRNIIGQSSSTVNFRELLDQRRILLVNTATGVIGPDAGGLLGAVLVDHINFAVREQMAVADPKARARAVVVVDEFQSIPGVDYQGLLAELQKMGASFILATQALGQLDAISKPLRPAIMSNVDTLFVFQTSAEDADILRHELDDEVVGTDIINLADHSCYLKTQLGRERLPVMHIETLPPSPGTPLIAQQILTQMTRYTRSGQIVEAERIKFQEEWFGLAGRLQAELDSLQEGDASAKPKENKPAQQSRNKNNSESKERKKKRNSPNADDQSAEKTEEVEPSDSTQGADGDQAAAINEQGSEHPEKTEEHSKDSDVEGEPPDSEEHPQVRTTLIEPSENNDENKHAAGSEADEKRINP
ncbi:MAG: type IV secretion system DNA-binding domain-containing protein [Chloroflexi bacterium]|nr:type IV secretion system DNA-binding domain-containing protein [Chloroflexota bacterium]